MILLLNAANRAAFPDLMDAMFAARHQVLVELRGWEELRRADGREVDALDRPDALYLLAVHQDRLLGGVRFTGTERPPLAADILPELFEEPPTLGPDVLEMSRLFSLADAGPSDTLSPLLGELLAAGAELSLIIGARGWLTIADLGLAQGLLAWGAHLEPLGLPRRTRQGAMVAIMAHASPRSVRMLRRARRITGPMLFWADDPATPPRAWAEILGRDAALPGWSPPGDATPLQRAHMTPWRLADLLGAPPP